MALILTVGFLLPSLVATGLAASTSSAGYVQPTAIATAPSLSLFSPFYYHFCASINGVVHSSAPIVNTTWVWGDGKKSYGSFPQTHTYSSRGTYHVRVIFTDSTGAKGYANKTVKITDPTTGKHPQLTLDSATVSGLTASINGWANMDACGPLPIAPLDWNWGDGSASTAWFVASHTYASSATYHVCAKGTDSLGLSTTKCEYVAV